MKWIAAFRKLRWILPFALAVTGQADVHDEIAAVQLGSLFTDHMVLQCDMPVRVWGTADPGSTVTVEFAGQKKSGVADTSAKWSVVLDPLTASAEGRTMTVYVARGETTVPQGERGGTVQVSDILVGEVWICSGQSNMQFPVAAVPEVKALVPSTRNIRSFTVKRTVAFTEQDFCEGEWVERHPDSAVAFSFAHFLEQAADAPVGIILTCWGSSSIEAWMPRDMTETVPHFKTMMDEFDADSSTRDRIQAILEGPKPWSRQDDVFLRRQSNILYNAMMKPLAPYACRGLVWYQGERNTQSMHGMVEDPWFSRNSGMLKYGEVLQQWIKRYRTEWKRDELHFLVVMLPGYHGKPMKTGPQAGADGPISHSWAWMRESQLKALDVPCTGVANTIDLGDVKNVHPRDKLPVGQRLALLAMRDTLGQPVEAEGPVMKTVEARGTTLVVRYDHAGGLKTTDDEMPRAFWLSDESERWVPAEAVIEGQTVVLQADALELPLYVRYAFAGMPKVNLVNGSGLPAYPFRTDRFEP